MPFFKPSGTRFTPSRPDCCDDDNFVSSIDFTQPGGAGNPWVITLTFQDGSTLSEPLPSAIAPNIEIQSFDRHPDALTNPAFENTIRIVETDGSTFDLDLSFLIPTSPLPVVYGNVITVTDNGDDAAAAAAGNYDTHTPWATYEAALAAAQPGDMIEVYPSSHTITGQLAKDGVCVYAHKGADFIYVTTATPFVDGGSPAHFCIRGDGKFQFNVSQDSITGITSDGTILDWEFDEIVSNGRFRYQQFEMLRFKGRKWVQQARGALSTRLTFAFLSSNEKQLFFEVEEYQAPVGGAEFGYDQIEIALQQELMYNIDIKNYHQNATVNIGYPIRLRGLHNTCQGEVRVAMVQSNVDNSRPFLYSEFDGSELTADIHIDGTLAGYWATNNTTPIAPATKDVSITGTFRDTPARRYNSMIRNLDYNILLKVNIVDFLQVNNPVVGGILLGDCPNATITGVFEWHNPNLNTAAIVLDKDWPNAGYLKDLAIKTRGGASSVRKRDLGAPVNLKVMNTYATTPVSTDNGGFVQLIEAITIDPNV